MVQVGRRVAKLRESHGESLREAALRTGVSHTTIARIEKGEVTGSFQSTLRKIAEGYGVRMEFLLGGRDVRQDFVFSLHRLAPEQRSRLYFVPARERIRMVMRFLLAEYPADFPPTHLAAMLGVSDTGLVAFVDGTDQPQELPLDEMHLAAGLAVATGIPRHWFLSGSLGEESGDLMPPEMVSAFVLLMKKAAMAGIQPEVLEMAIDLLIMKNEQGERR